MLRSEADGAGAVRTPGAMIGELICKTEMLYGISFTLFCNVLLVAGDGGAKTDFAASDVGNIDEAELSGGVAGGLVESSGENGAVGDFVKFLGIKIVEEYVEAELVFDD
ncbi:LOW QUALITY PROTEIN: hypothetical protein RJ641_016918 [Dillenia turbinata]|uniref:Uncharacterized protein n=1 Tax=Dillenia turbinata TaxID=194707 RepID=A0AAN8YZ46_9MAGN